MGKSERQLIKNEWIYLHVYTNVAEVILHSVNRHATCLHVQVHVYMLHVYL